MVLRRCRALLRSDAQAEDAMHDVFVAVLRAGGRLDDDAPAALLLRVATNVCLNRLRTSAPAPRGAPTTSCCCRSRRRADDGEARARRRENLLGKLFGADDPLAASTATLAVMHLFDGMTLEETAREAGLSVSGVRKRLERLRGRLAALETAERMAHELH